MEQDCILVACLNAHIVAGQRSGGPSPLSSRPPSGPGREDASVRESIRSCCITLAEASWRMLLPALSLLLGKCHGEALALKLLKVRESKHHTHCVTLPPGLTEAQNV